MGLFSRLVGKSDPKLDPVSLSELGVDMHSHLIPGIDDGSKSMDETIAMLVKFESLGYRKLFTTPHIMSDYYRNTPEIILDGLEQVKKVAGELNLSIQLEAAAEYYFDESLIQRLRNKERLLTFGNQYVLFEFSFHSIPSHNEELFFELITQGYKPVLAHFERYMYYLGSVDKALEFREKGIHIQLNLNSLAGHYGPEIKKQAEALIDAGAVDFAGSDCHRIDHLMMLERNLNLPYMHKLLQLPLKNNLL